MSLMDDPDWGHKPEDDDFKITSDMMDYFRDFNRSMSIDSALGTITRENAAFKGSQYYEEGNYDCARAVFEKGANQYNDPMCCFKYAVLLIENIGEEKFKGVISYDTFLAEGYLCKAVAAQIPEAAYVYGVYLTIGKGMAKDENKAKKYIKMAADWGYQPAIDIWNEYKKLSRRSLWSSIKSSFVSASFNNISDVIVDKGVTQFVNFLTRFFY